MRCAVGLTNTFGYAVHQIALTCEEINLLGKFPVLNTVNYLKQHYASAKYQNQMPVVVVVVGLFCQMPSVVGFAFTCIYLFIIGVFVVVGRI